MNYPSIDEIEAADHEQICRWWRFLPSPSSVQDLDAARFIGERFSAFGGFTPELSKKIGWKEN